MVPVTTSSLDAASVVSRPIAASPPADASINSGLVAPNLPSGPAYRKYHANCIPVTSHCRAQGSAGRKRSDAQIELLIKFSQMNKIVVNTVQIISSVLLPCE